jgi:hypothetical protein
VAVAVDAVHVYWSDGARIMRIPKLGGVAELVLEDSVSWPLIVDGETLFWSALFGRRVSSAPTSGEPITTLAQGADIVTDLAHDSDYLYWQAHHSFGPEAGQEARVTRVPKVGGPSEIMATRPGRFEDLTAGSGQVAWTSIDGVERLNVEDGTVDTLYRGLAEAITIDTDGEILFSAAWEPGAPPSTVFRTTAHGVYPIFEALSSTTALLAGDEFI